MQIKSIPTKPVEGQKTGTSGLRKKASTSCFMFHDLAPISDTLFFFWGVYNSLHTSFLVFFSGESVPAGELPRQLDSGVPHFT